MQIINPKDGAVLQDVAETTPEQVGAAVARARAAQRAWQEGGYAPRRAALLAFRDIVAGRSEELARVLADRQAAASGQERAVGPAGSDRLFPRARTSGAGAAGGAPG